MKKILLLLLLTAVMPWRNAVLAQCDIIDIAIKYNHTEPVLGTDSSKISFDFSFTMLGNGGNKYIYLHAWLQENYPNPAIFGDCSKGNYPAPLLADLNKSGPNKITIGIHNELHPQHPAPSLLTTYGPDPSVPITPSDPVLIWRVSGDTGFFTIKNVGVTVADPSVPIFMIADAWSANAQSANSAQCVTCRKRFVLNDPSISGNVACATSTQPLRYNLFIDSRYRDLTGSLVPVSGFYRVYIDVDRDGAINDADLDDILISGVDPVPFTTSVALGTPEFTRYYVLNQPYIPSLPLGDTNSNKPLLVKAWVTSLPGLYGGSVIGTLANNCAPLPVTLKGFDAQKNQTGVMLNWETAMEYSFSGFDIQRKLGNGGAFESIGFVAARGEEQGGAVYSYTDASLPAGTMAFYRLRMVDVDGKAIYSEIKAVRNDSRRMYVTVTPNPSNGYVNVSVPADAGIYDVMLLDFSGKMLQNMNGVRNQMLRFSNLMPGMYILKIQFRETGEQIAERIIVQ